MCALRYAASAEDSLVVEHQSSQRVALRSDAPVALMMSNHQVRQIVGGADDPRINELLLRQ